MDTDGLYMDDGDYLNVNPEPTSDPVVRISKYA